MSYTISESFTLPSKGLIYNPTINPVIKLRSMTVEDEMRRLSHSEVPYKNIADIIDSCIVDEIPISCYDMCIGDFQFLLYKLRTVTYGSNYTVSSTCPLCGFNNITDIDLDNRSIIEYTDKYSELLTISLPESKKIVTLKYQTPRQLDNIELKKKELLRRNPEALDPSLYLTIESIIDKVDDVKLDPVKLTTFVRSMPMKDANIILQSAQKIDSAIGIDILIDSTCEACGHKYSTFFRITQEFFRPRIH